MNEMTDWDDVRLFLAVARYGGLAAAAEATGKSPPTLGRRIAAFEKEMGAELFRRRPRGYELTDDGRTLLARAVEVEAQTLALAGTVSADRTTLVKVSAGTWMTMALSTRASELLGDDESLCLRFIAADHVLDIARRETVIGLRNQRPEESQLVCRRVGTVRFAGYAVHRRVGRWLRVMGNTPSARYSRKESLEESLEESQQRGPQQSGAALEVTQPRTALDLALAGVGRAVLPTFIGDAQGGLQRVTPLLESLQHEQWLVTHPTERFVPEVRAVIDRMYTVLRGIHQR